MSKKPRLSGVTETMLQTIYARAKETKTRGAIKDSKAVEIIDSLDYDFSLADKDSAMHNGVIARTIVLDRLAGKFLRLHPGAVAVNIACGLDTRCYRMKGYSHWYNLDLPETIEVRRSILPPTEKITQIAMSAMDDWGGEVAENGVPALVIIEGLTMYLSEADVQRIFSVISARFGKAQVLVEVMNPAVAKRFREKSIDGEQASPSLAQAKRLRELDKEGKLNGDVIDGILSEQKKEDRGVIISTAELEKYFGKEVTPAKMKEQIMSLLDDWKEKQPPELAKAPKKQALDK